MRWLLAGYCGLVLISISVCSAAQNQALQVSQKPRFYGLSLGHNILIYCYSSKPDVYASVEWYKAAEYNSDTENRKKVQQGHRIEIHTTNLTIASVLCIHDLHIEDSGLYFCEINRVMGPGTQVNVARPVNRVAAQYRTNMKDGLIVFQGLLLAVCIASILLRKRKLWEKSDSIYEEPETDHIYEGLAIETCGGGLYEELSIYAQPEAEAPWE